MDRFIAAGDANGQYPEENQTLCGRHADSLFDVRRRRVGCWPLICLLRWAIRIVKKGMVLSIALFATRAAVAIFDMV